MYVLTINWLDGRVTQRRWDTSLVNARLHAGAAFARMSKDAQVFACKLCKHFGNETQHVLAFERVPVLA